MTRTELIEQALKAAQEKGSKLNKLEMNNAFKAICEVAAAELLGGGEVSLPGIGKLRTREVRARTGRNPKTGEKLDIPASKKVAFIHSSELKNALRG